MLKLLALAAVTLTLAACGGSGSSSPAPPAPPAQPGDPAVYTEIAAMTSCTDLQAAFDRAYANWQREHDAGNITLEEITTAYMKAAQARRDALGC